MYTCHSILECYNLFSGVKLSIRSFCFISKNEYHAHKKRSCVSISILERNCMNKGPHNIYELHWTGVSGKRSSKKYLSGIYCRRKSHGPVQSKRKSHSPVYIVS